MADLVSTHPKVPTVLTCKVNALDKPVVTELMTLTGITDSTQLVRHCLRAALRELATVGAPVTSTKQHRPASTKG